MDFEKIAREKIKVGLISVETLAEWLKEAYVAGGKNGFRRGIQYQLENNR